MISFYLKVNIFCCRKKAVQANGNDATKANEKITQQITKQDHENSKNPSLRADEDRYIKPNAFVDANSSAYVNTVKKPGKNVEANHSEYENEVKNSSYENIAYQNNSKKGNDHVYEQL